MFFRRACSCSTRNIGRAPSRCQVPSPTFLSLDVIKHVTRFLSTSGSRHRRPRITLPATHSASVAPRCASDEHPAHSPRADSVKVSVLQSLARFHNAAYSRELPAPRSAAGPACPQERISPSCSERYVAPARVFHAPARDSWRRSPSAALVHEAFAARLRLRHPLLARTFALTMPVSARVRDAYGRARACATRVAGRANEISPRAFRRCAWRSSRPC